MKKIIIGLIAAAMILAGCAATSKYQVGTTIPSNVYVRDCSDVLTPQTFRSEHLQISIQPEENELIITVDKTKNSRVKDSPRPGEITVDIIYLNSIREIIHVIHFKRPVMWYPFKHHAPIPLNLDVSYITVGYHVKWWS